MGQVATYRSDTQRRRWSVFFDSIDVCTVGQEAEDQFFLVTAISASEVVQRCAALPVRQIGIQTVFQQLGGHSGYVIQVAFAGCEDLWHWVLSLEEEAKEDVVDLRGLVIGDASSTSADDCGIWCLEVFRIILGEWIINIPQHGRCGLQVTILKVSPDSLCLSAITVQQPPHLIRVCAFGRRAGRVDS